MLFPIVLNFSWEIVDIIKEDKYGTDGVGNMAIDQNSLNSLLAVFAPRSNMAALREQRARLLQKLQQNPENQDGGRQQAEDIKNNFRELAAVDQQISQAMYEEMAGKLEEERLKQEAASARKERTRERALAKHERFLENKSMGKLLSAAVKSGYPGGVGGPGVNGSGQGDTNYVSDAERDLQEAVQYGIAAAEVATRRKNAEAKAQTEESAQKRQAAQRKRAKSKSVNIIV